MSLCLTSLTFRNAASVFIKPIHLETPVLAAFTRTIGLHSRQFSRTSQSYKRLPSMNKQETALVAGTSISGPLLALAAAYMKAKSR